MPQLSLFLSNQHTEIFFFLFQFFQIHEAKFFVKFDFKKKDGTFSNLAYFSFLKKKMRTFNGSRRLWVAFFLRLKF